MLKFIGKILPEWAKHYILPLAIYMLIIIFCVLPVGAIYRYWESRRRIHNDSQPDRAIAVEQNKKNSKRKLYQSRVCYCNYVLVVLYTLLAV